MLSTDKQKQTDRQTNATKNITSFTKEVIKALWDYWVLTCMNLTQHYALTAWIPETVEPTNSNKLKRFLKSDPGL